MYTYISGFRRMNENGKRKIAQNPTNIGVKHLNPEYILNLTKATKPFNGIISVLSVNRGLFFICQIDQYVLVDFEFMYQISNIMFILLNLIRTSKMMTMEYSMNT